MTDPNAWLLEAKCRGMDTDLFFTTRGEQYALEAREACAACPVRAECLADALSYNDHSDLGLRAGLSEQQRRKMRRRMQRTARCLQCGGEFVRRGTMTYCSAECVRVGKAARAAQRRAS